MLCSSEEGKEVIVGHEGSWCVCVCVLACWGVLGKRERIVSEV